MDAVAISPDGRPSTSRTPSPASSYPIDFATSACRYADRGAEPKFRQTIAITPDGSFALVVGNAGVTPIDLATRVPRPMIPISGGTPQSIAITPDGTTAYVVTDTRRGGADHQQRRRVGHPGRRRVVGHRHHARRLGPRTWRSGSRTPRCRSIWPPARRGHRSPGSVRGLVGGDRARPGPVAHLTVTPAPVGAATTFDASSSTADTGTITEVRMDVRRRRDPDHHEPDDHTRLRLGRHLPGIGHRDQLGRHLHLARLHRDDHAPQRWPDGGRDRERRNSRTGRVHGVRGERRQTTP